MATYIIALRPVFGRASGLVRVGPDGARFSLRGVSFGRAHLILQNGRTRSANVRPTPGGGTAFIPLRAREFPLGAAVTVRGVVVLIGTTGTRASDILERARQLAADPEQRRAEEAGYAEEITETPAGAELSGLTEKAPPLQAERAPSPVEPPAAPKQTPPAQDLEKPEAFAAMAAKEEPFLMPQPPMAQVEPPERPVSSPERAEPPAGSQEILQKWQMTRDEPETAAKPPEAALNRKETTQPLIREAFIPSGPAKQAEAPAARSAPEAEQGCAACTEEERGGMIASFMMEQEAPPAASQVQASPREAPGESAPQGESRDFMEASPHAFYQPILDDDDWNIPSAASGETRPMLGRRLGVFSNAFPGDWPRVNWQVFSHPGGTHLLRARLEDRELYAIPARPSATPPAGIPATARYCVSRTGQGYWVF